MKNLNMISRRSFLKAALAASAVSAMALTGCGGAASSTASSAAVSSSAAASGSTAAAGETFKVGIVNYVDHASLNHRGICGEPSGRHRQGEGRHL